MLGERECTCQPYLHEDELQRFLEMGSFQSFKASMELLVEGDKKVGRMPEFSSKMHRFRRIFSVTSTL